MNLRTIERIAHVRLLKKHIEDATSNLEGLRNSYVTHFTGTKGEAFTSAYDNLLDILHALKFDIHDDNTVSLKYEDHYNGKIKISYEQMYSMHFCYAIMVFYTETTCALRDILKFIPKHDWSTDPLYTFQVDLTTSLHVIFS